MLTLEMKELINYTIYTYFSDKWFTINELAKCLKIKINRNDLKYYLFEGVTINIIKYKNNKFKIKEFEI